MYITVKYASVDDDVDTILRLGMGCYLVKTNIKSAFLIMPVHAYDYYLLGIHWKSLWFFDLVELAPVAVFETLSRSLQYHGP